MAKDETKQTRDEAKNNRRVSGEVPETLPLVSAKRGKFETVENAKVEALVFARLEDYKQFVAEVESEEPDTGAVISAGLEMLFDADKGFERWATEQRRKNRNGSHISAKGSTAAATAG
ncbi:MAG: hypothetical protein M3430_19475 [Acidobacteriota bacterium]|nr:hypothetical protein [Acidobacteriota bacterium]